MKFKILWPGICVLLLLSIGTFFDYEITHALYSPQSIFGMIFERIMLLPIIGLLPLSFAVLYGMKSSMWYLLAVIFSCSYLIGEITYAFSLPFSTLYILGLGLLISIFICYKIRKVDGAILRKYEKITRFFLCVFFTSMFITTILKIYWGRVRYRELEDITQFTKWYVIQGINGNFSFPSGHTTACTSMLCFLPVVLKWFQKKYVVYIIVFGFIILMMFSRLVMGAHYLSDTTIGFLITYLVYIYYKRKFYKEM